MCHNKITNFSEDCLLILDPTANFATKPSKISK